MTDDLIVAAIRSELDRGGQVYYVHNRVRGLDERAKELEERVPGARFTLAHGQMSGHQLEKTMWDFFGRKFDVLVASSIIESGLDIPSVNTLIVENAHEFGLAQLYQLRGRIGRERTRAYCFLTYPAELGGLKGLTEEARLRLEALQEFAHLGSGFQLAMRDLEIRGAGELLGSRQHGMVTAVGLETYCELLREETERLRGRGFKEQNQPATLDLKIAAYLPADYVPDEMQRLDLYKRVLAADDKGLEAIRTELADLAGAPPPPVENLLRLASLRLRATKAGVRSVLERERVLEVFLRPDVAVGGPTLKRWTSVYGKRLAFVGSPEGDGVRLALLRAPADELDAFLLTLEGK